jgi:cell division protein FtsI (penicillin-binding protein 3)
MAEENAAGGDLIFADPRTGEVLAAASRRRGQGNHWRGVTDPYEPGSTIKPFVLAALLDRGLATLEDSLFAEQRPVQMGRRTISDVSPHGWLTAAEVLRFSSNVGIVKLAGAWTRRRSTRRSVTSASARRRAWAIRRSRAVA